VSPEPNSANSPAPFRAVGLYLLKGLLRAASDAAAEGHAAWDREIVLSSGHLYGRECRANAWTAKGACYLKTAQEHYARDAFGEALALVPGHAQARAGLAIVDGPDGQTVPGLANDSCTAVEPAIARAAVLVHAGDVAAAVAMVHAALRAAHQAIPAGRFPSTRCCVCGSTRCVGAGAGAAPRAGAVREGDGRLARFHPSKR
jgi:hypothetical protein